MILNSEALKIYIKTVTSKNNDSCINNYKCFIAKKS